MGSIIAAIAGSVVKWALSYFTTSPEEKLGRAEVTVEAQNKELKNVQVKNTIDNRIDGAAPADIKRMSDTLDGADK